MVYECPLSGTCKCSLGGPHSTKKVTTELFTHRHFSAQRTQSDTNMSFSHSQRRMLKNKKSLLMHVRKMHSEEFSKALFQHNTEVSNLLNK